MILQKEEYNNFNIEEAIKIKNIDGFRCVNFAFQASI